MIVVLKHHTVEACVNLMTQSILVENSDIEIDILLLTFQCREEKAKDIIEE